MKSKHIELDMNQMYRFDTAMEGFGGLFVYSQADEGNTDIRHFKLLGLFSLVTIKEQWKTENNAYNIIISSRYNCIAETILHMAEETKMSEYFCNFNHPE